MVRLRSLDELTDYLEQMADWRERLGRRLEPINQSNVDVLMLAAEVKAFGWCCKCIERQLSDGNNRKADAGANRQVGEG